MPDDTTEEINETVATEVGTGRAKHGRVRSRRRSLVEWAVIVVAALVVSLLMRSYVVQTFYIPSGSMEPTLQIGDRLIVSKLSVEWGTIHRGDILVFDAPSSASVCGPSREPIFVKRVIGLPGDTIYSKGNTIYIDGKVLKETWSHFEPVAPPIVKTVVPANEYFMMGDNHADSCDSRYWGALPQSDIIGKAFIRIWPISRFAFL